MNSLELARDDLLRAVGSRLWECCYSEQDFNGGAPIRISSLRRTSGPRSGVLSVDGGMHADRLRQTLTAQDGAKLRALFPVGWIGDNDKTEPEVRFIGKRLVIEANWPEHLQTRVLPFSDVKQRPGNGRSFTLGRDMRNTDVVIALGKISTHTLVGGGTGSGKTVTLWTILRQLQLVENARFILVNGKGRRGLGFINGLRGQVGPMAIENQEARDAIGWVYNLMQERNRQDEVDLSPVYLVIDEFDVFTMSDSLIAQMLFMLVKMGREVGIFVFCATQSPKQEMFGNNGTRAQFGVRIALRVSNRHESEAIIGATEPRADHLSGSGDAHVATDELCTRTLIALTTEEEARAIGGGEPEFSHWPQFSASSVTDNGKPGPEAQPFTNEEAVIGLYSRLNDWGRWKINNAMKAILGYGMGPDRIEKRLIPLGDELATLWQKLGES